MKIISFKVSDHKLEQKEHVEHLCIHLDENLTYQNEVKIIVHKMPCGIETLYCGPFLQLENYFS